MVVKPPNKLPRLSAKSYVIRQEIHWQYLTKVHELQWNKMVTVFPFTPPFS